jgi:5-methyltetrahydrofolate--homocysteine methyltransferase
MEMTSSSKLVDAIAHVREQEAIRLAQQMCTNSTSAGRILGLIRDGVRVVGRRFENGEYFLPELVMSGEIVRQISEIIGPKLTGVAAGRHRGRVLIGTVRGDIHDLGKNIVATMLEVNGFDVVDLGVDVPADDFVRGVDAYEPDVVALSGLLTSAYHPMKETVEAIGTADLGKRVKIMIGGGRMDDRIRQYTGADAYGEDAIDAVRLVEGWVAEP